MENCLFVTGVIVLGILIVFLIQQGEKFCAKKIQAGIMSVVGVIIELRKKEGNPRMFDNVINEDAIQELTPEQVEQVLSILEKAGY